MCLYLIMGALLPGDFVAVAGTITTVDVCCCCEVLLDVGGGTMAADTSDNLLSWVLLPRRSTSSIASMDAIGAFPLRKRGVQW